MHARRTSTSILLGLLVSAMTASQASAQEPGPRATQPAGGTHEPSRVPSAEPPPPPPREESTAAPGLVATSVEHERYGVDIILVDAAVLVTSIALESPTVALAGYGLGGPAVHLMHGNRGGAIYSLATRGLLPAAAFLVGGTIAHSNCLADASCGMGGAYIGGLLGIGAAIVIDWTVLAKKPARPPRAAGLTVAPSLMIDEEQISFSLAGAF